MITVQKKFDKIGPVIAGVLMITVLFIASFFLTGWGSYLLLFFLRDFELVFGLASPGRYNSGFFQHVMD